MSQIDPQQYVSWFRHSSPYINAYRGKVFVVLLPGEALVHPLLPSITHDITLLNSLGVKLVLVHGARPQIAEALELSGMKDTTHQEIQNTMHNELRVTDAGSMDIIKQVIGKVRIDLEALFSMGLVNSPMHNANLNLATGNYIQAKPFGIHNGIDFGYTGEVRKVDHEAIKQQLDCGSVVLVSNLGYSPTGEVFNLTVEEVACATAIALKADKLLIYSKETGILDTDGKAISKLSADQAQALIDKKVAENGLDDQLKNLELSVKACMSTVKRSQVISYTQDGSLLTELFTRDGAGTLITQESYEALIQATIDDVGGIFELIRPLEEKGVLVERSRELIESEIDRFCVIKREGTIIGCGALYPLNEDSGEIACLVVHPEYRDADRGLLLLDHLEKNAGIKGIKNLYVLTTKTPHWFIERGFSESTVAALPEQRKSMYNFQRNSKVFLKQL